MTRSKCRLFRVLCDVEQRKRTTKKEGCHIETEEKIAAGVIERREEKNRHIIGCLLPSSLPLSLSFLLVAVSHYPLLYTHTPPIWIISPQTNVCLPPAMAKKSFTSGAFSSSTSLPNYAYACKQQQEAQTTADFHYPSRSSIMSRRLFISFLLLLDPLSYPRG